MRRHRSPKWLRASTLIEVLVALVIITLVMAIAATLYVKMGWKRPDNLLNLHLELKALAEETKRTKDYTPAEYERDDGLAIDRAVQPYQGDTLLLLLELRAKKQGTDEEAVYREIIIHDQ
ncbi:type II secretion system protein [Parapedobacter deserti]|uniref:Type II secretion system protein n=1 Tax=Parapedobacter deserti TaxID=1912957 RepID=A0ABV7JKK1_9SPHI